MRALRPLFGLIIALTLGTAAGASHAGGITDMAGHRMAASLGVDEPMPDGCPDCPDDGAMTACAQTACGLVAAILPQGFVPAAGAPAVFLPAPDTTAAGAPGSTDPPPPRSSVVA
jgi:hypothetical protein